MGAKLDWLKLPGKHFSLSGLPFTNGAQWHRFSDEQTSALPKEVVRQSRYPAGAVVRFKSDTGSLSLKLIASSEPRGAGIDLMVDGILWKTAIVSSGDNEIELFNGLARVSRVIELYLPGNQEVDIKMVGVDVQCSVVPVPRDDSHPIVFYGSSIVQGAGSNLACMNYPSIISRKLQVNTVNFGFYGAGRGEPEVVSEILKVPAEMIVFDLGKSFGNQPAEIYGNMLANARETQPDARLVCVTPIFCLKENYDARFRSFSDSLREKFEQQCSAFPEVHIINGLDLLGKDDWSCFSTDGLHPNESGYAKIAERLIQTLRL